MYYEDIEEAKKLVIKAALEMQRTGLIVRTWGNVSARINHDEFVITPSGRSYDSLTPDDIVKVRINDLSYDGNITPSSEKGVHAEVYKKHRRASFVIHTHQDYSTALSTLKRPLNIETLYPDRVEDLGPVVPVSEYAPFGTKKLMANVATALKENPKSRAVLMQNHGVVVFGRTDEEAMDTAKSLEKFCEHEYSHLTGRQRIDILYPFYSITNFCRVFRRDKKEEYEAQRDLFAENKDAAYVVYAYSPYIKEASDYKFFMRAYNDDLAQIAGPVIPIKSAVTPHRKIAQALKNSGGVMLLNGIGAVVTGTDKEDAFAKVACLDKCAMTSLMQKAHLHPTPVSFYDAEHEHLVYLNSYSKLKDKD